MHHTYIFKMTIHLYKNNLSSHYKFSQKSTVTFLYSAMQFEISFIQYFAFLNSISSQKLQQNKNIFLDFGSSEVLFTQALKIFFVFIIACSTGQKMIIDLDTILNFLHYVLIITLTFIILTATTLAHYREKMHFNSAVYEEHSLTTCHYIWTLQLWFEKNYQETIELIEIKLSMKSILYSRIILLYLLYRLTDIFSINLILLYG